MIELEPLTAWDPAERVLEPAVAAAINATGAVTVTPMRPPDGWRLEPSSLVGVLVGEGWVLRIQPRLRIPRLMFLLAYSLRPEGWRDELAPFAEADDVVSALASGFAVHAERALEQGVLRGYVTIDERREDLRGRIRFGDQLARSRGLPLPLEVSYDDFSADIIENRLLRTAAELLLLYPRIPARTRGRLMRVRAILDEVSVMSDRGRPQVPAVTPLNARYASAMELARLVLSNTSIASRAGGLTVTSFLFDMNEVFESFLYSALRESLFRFGGSVERQAVGALDVGTPSRLAYRADIVWKVRGEVRAVIDSKYKPLSSSGAPPNSDAYQMLAYCIGYGLRRGFLVYARDAIDEPRQHEVKRHGYLIDVRAVDVEQEPAGVLREVDELTEALVATTTMATVMSTMPALTA